MIINLKFLNGNTREITVTEEQTVKDIKINFLKMEESKLDEVKIIYSGKILQNSQTIGQLQLSDKSFFVVLTTTKATLDTLSTSHQQSSGDEESIDGDLFVCSDDDDDDAIPFGSNQEETQDEKIEEENIEEVIQKNNEKFLELIKDENFKTLVNIIINKPEYLTYALKFVQSGMIFKKPNYTEEELASINFDSELEVLKNMNIEDDVEKLKKALEISSGDIQIAIRYLFLSQYDDSMTL